MVVFHEYHCNLVIIGLCNVDHLIQWVFTERQNLILINIWVIEYLLYRLNALNEAGSSYLIVVVVSVVDADDLLVFSVV